jgi:hypothetical protein
LGRRVERRAHKRHRIACPVRIAGGEGGSVGAAKAENISDGGLLVPVASEAALPRGAVIQVEFAVPRSTPNTFLYEQFSAAASVVRRGRTKRSGLRNVALKFEPPMDLGLEV